MTDKTRFKPGQSAFLFDDNTTLLPGVAQQVIKKLVSLLSSMHGQADIHEQGKPEIIMYYKKTKEGVDTFYQICSNNSCSRMTKRWPMAIFYGMVNAAGVNASILHHSHVVNQGKKHKCVGGSWKNSHLSWYDNGQRWGLPSQNFYWASEKLWKWHFLNLRSFQYRQDPNNCQSTRSAGFALTAEKGRPNKSAPSAIILVRVCTDCNPAGKTSCKLSFKSWHLCSFIYVNCKQSCLVC